MLLLFFLIKNRVLIKTNERIYKSLQKKLAQQKNANPTKRGSNPPE